MGLAKMGSGVACFTIATLISMTTTDLIFHAGDVGRDEVLENRDRLILCTLGFCLGLFLSKTVFSNPLGFLFF
ncbi:hypothetical protein MRBBS_3010 [Marinobacter sp. BSs20148]|nr:hypothetical protein MRBBS_3010 [Marinobacter sp. BSs20148]